MNKQAGGPAFPQHDPVANEFHKKYGTDRGMTLRDYFAAKAMQSMVGLKEVQLALKNEESIDRIARASYEWADKMLKAREQ